jgi:hypothetical protein
MAPQVEQFTDNRRKMRRSLSEHAVGGDSPNEPSNQTFLLLVSDSELVLSSEYLIGRRWRVPGLTR